MLSSGCSSWREVLPVEVKTVEIERKIPIQNRPRPVKLNDIYFYVVNTENFDAFKDRFQKEHGDLVFYGLSVRDYETISYNMAELKRFIDSSNTFIENNAYIYSFFGRKRRLPEAKSTNQGVAKHAIRSGVNFLVQSVASDINLLGVIDLIEWVEQESYQDDILPFTVVHDSIVSEVREDLIDTYVENAKTCIQKDRGLSIPNLSLIHI